MGADCWYKDIIAFGKDWLFTQFLKNSNIIILSNFLFDFGCNGYLVLVNR